MYALIFHFKKSGRGVFFNLQHQQQQERKSRRAQLAVEYFGRVAVPLLIAVFNMYYW